MPKGLFLYVFECVECGMFFTCAEACAFVGARTSGGWGCLPQSLSCLYIQARSLTCPYTLAIQLCLLWRLPCPCLPSAEIIKWPSHLCSVDVAAGDLSSSLHDCKAVSAPPETSLQSITAFLKKCGKVDSKIHME